MTSLWIGHCNFRTDDRSVKVWKSTGCLGDDPDLADHGLRHFFGVESSPIKSETRFYMLLFFSIHTYNCQTFLFRVPKRNFCATDPLQKQISHRLPQTRVELYAADWFDLGDCRGCVTHVSFRVMWKTMMNFQRDPFFQAT